MTKKFSLNPEFLLMFLVAAMFIVIGVVAVLMMEAMSPSAAYICSWEPRYNCVPTPAAPLLKP